MTTRRPPRLVPAGNLAAYFSSRGIAFTQAGPLKLGFGHGEDQYQFYPYPPPADDETMGVFCEWHTEDYLEVDSGPHIAIGMRGPVIEDPHRGRGLAIGILANRTNDPDNPVPLFKGCPDPPGGPSFFIEDFTICDGRAPISDWQLSTGQHLPQLRGHGLYRIDIHVSRDNVWAGVWQVTTSHSVEGESNRDYRLIGQTASVNEKTGGDGRPLNMGCEDALDRGKGNAFIGTGFSDPQTSSWVDNIYIAHWKNPV